MEAIFLTRIESILSISESEELWTPKPCAFNESEISKSKEVTSLVFLLLATSNCFLRESNLVNLANKITTNPKYKSMYPRYVKNVPNES